MNLNPEQQKAVTHGDCPLLILAGAGSGKTMVLTHRIAYLLTEKGVSPEDVLAVTFTNKASGEMKERVEKLTGIPSSMLWVSTFHSFCLRVLRQYASTLGYSDTFTVFDSRDQVALVKACLKELNINEELISPSMAVECIGRAKDEFVTPGAFEAEASNFWKKRMASVYGLYQSELVKQNAMDFGDLLVNVLHLFEKNHDVLGYFQNKFKYVLVDEYQDTNHVQYRLIRHLGDLHKNIFVVGDEDQSIYRWRGADIKNILEFKKDFPEAVVIKLEQNYRSTPTILNAANSLIKNNEGRIGKVLWTDLPDKDRITMAQKVEGVDEAKYVVREMQRWSQKGYRYDDMAIFYRTNAQSRVFEECFRNFGIPYIVYGGVKFYERKEIKDILAYLKLILDGKNDTAFLRIINVPPRGIGKVTIDKIKSCSRGNGLSFFGAIHEMIKDGSIKAHVLKKLRAFMEMIEDIKGKMESLSLGELTKLVVEASGYMSFYKSSSAIDAEDRVENIQEFIRAAYEFKGGAKVSLPEFLDQVALVSDIDSMDNDKGVVSLMTVHLSKGLEFPVVFMVGMEEGLFPHLRSMDDDEAVEEERRLCYVGMTRAKDKLHMTYCSRRRLYGREQYNLPSRFLDEVDENCVEREFLTVRSNYYEASKYFSGNKNAEHASYDMNEDFDQRPEDEKNSGLRLGTKVVHPVFGEGVVRKIEGLSENQKVIVQFNTGQIKTLVVKYAQLKIVNL